MAPFSTPSTQTTGHVVTSAEWNELVTDIIGLRAGHSTMRSGGGYSTLAVFGADTVFGVSSPLVLDPTILDSLSSGSTVQLRVVSQYRITALGGCTNLNMFQKLFCVQAGASSGSLLTYLNMRTWTNSSPSVSTFGQDSGSLALTAFTTDISAFGPMVLLPAYSFVATGGNPTIDVVSSSWHVRLA